MKNKLLAILALTLLSSLNFPLSTAHAQGTAFSYQGRLNTGGSLASGSYDLVFTLYTTNTTGNAIAGPVTNPAVTVVNGLFTTLVDFGPGAFTGTSNWLALAVSTNGANSFSLLGPRQQVTPTPYALLAGSASGVPGLTIQQYSSGAPNLIVGAADNFVAPGTIGATIDGGTNNSVAATWSGVGGGDGNSIAAGAYVSWLGGGLGNMISNNAIYAVICGGQNNSIAYVDHAFIGGGGGNGIQGNQTGLNNGVVSFSSIVGGSGNNIGLSAFYSFIGGGQANAIGTSAYWSVLGGGEQNNVLAGYSFLGGGEGNNIDGSASEATLVGGQYNTINFLATQTFLGGGEGNTIDTAGYYDVLVGGQGNIVGGYNSAVGGGYKNNAINNYATVPGGSNNVASGVDSFAAGSAAQATNSGAFVWADLESTPFTSTTANSFNVRASGGVNFVTGGTGVTVDGQRLFAGTNGGALFGLNASQLTFGTVPLAQLPASVVTNNESVVFLGSLFLNNNLTVEGNLLLSATPTFYAGGSRLLASDANNNSSFGLLAGNGGGNNNTALGAGALSSSSTGNNNVATGAGALQNNTASFNTADGGYALQANTTGNNNVAVGYNALNANTTGVNNTASGFAALQNSTNNYSTAVGGFALQNLITGDNNIALGFNAGNNLTNGANNIYIGNGAHPSESGVIRIGDPNNQTLTYIAGVIQDPSVTTITITGGSDLAEPFSISTPGQIVSEGAVVVIDEANPGQLKLTDQPYDTHVAGVISGANGIHPGIQMHQQGMLEGGKNVALSGRVYVQADTSNGAIKPGDLLTTSSTPGRAMKVSDHIRAAGAILGKAMTGLAEGNGMVLVLVTLQ